jgi:hypothetical protein
MSDNSILMKSDLAKTRKVSLRIQAFSDVLELGEDLVDDFIHGSDSENSQRGRRY